MKTFFFKATDKIIQKMGALIASFALSTAAFADSNIVSIDNHTPFVAHCSAFPPDTSIRSESDIIDVLNKNSKNLEKCDGLQKFSIEGEASTQPILVVCRIEFHDTSETEYIRTSISISERAEQSPCTLKITPTGELYSGGADRTAVELYCRDAPNFVYGRTRDLLISEDTQNYCQKVQKEETPE